MTNKELNIKLARDVARIRIVNEVVASAAGKAPKTSISTETIKAMDDIDAGKEESIIAELNMILSDEKAMEYIRTMIPAGYIKHVQFKLSIHKKARESSMKGYSKFSATDRKKAVQYEAIEVSKAATLIKTAYENKSEAALINAAAAEAFGYDMKRLILAIGGYLGPGAFDFDGKKIGFKTELLLFSDGAQAAIEHLEKTSYYGVNIYERFTPLGVIKVTWTRETVATCATKDAIESESEASSQS